MNWRISKHGNYEDPQKSPWDYEVSESQLEQWMMERLEGDATVVRWMKRHGITIPWIDSQKHQRRYVPDFLVDYEDGHKEILEVKDPSRMDSDNVRRKPKAAEIWCEQRHIEYKINTIQSRF